MTMIKYKFLGIFSRLTLTIGSFLIQVILGYSYKNCIEVSCKTKFKCMNRYATTLTAFVKDLPPTATTLNISHNTLSKIPPHSFAHLQNLTHLTLDSNKISSINEHVFNNLNHLKSLNLSSNNLTGLHPGSFKSLYALTELLLGDNKLQSLPPGIFNGSTYLQNLIIRRNILTNFSAVIESVKELTHLTRLDLSYNELKSLDNSADLPSSLQVLYLSNNKFTTLGCQPGLLSRISVLDFSNNNNLSSIHFKGLNLSKIKFVRLRFTNVTVPELLKHAPSLNLAHIDFSGLNLGNNSMIRTLCWLLRNSSTEIPWMVLQQNKIRNLEDRLFFNCTKLTGSLDLSMNNLKSVKCLQFLEGQHRLQKITVEHNLLTELNSCNLLSSHHHHFNFTTELSFRYNRILKVNKFAFVHTPRLETLKLNINTIAFMDHQALRNLTNLTTLRLDNNLLTDLYADSFIDLHSLETLNLRNNQISVIFKNTFQSLKRLNILDLGGNKITQFREGAFTGLEKLRNIYFDRNRLKQIEIYKFAKLSATLRVLDLQSNMISYVTEQTTSPFANFSKLVDLKLDAQQPYGITLLPHAFFSGLISLTSLSLTNNHISSFRSDAFDDLPSLEYLNLDTSCVGVIPLPSGIFKNMQKLKTLQAENMGIDSISEHVFWNLTSLQRLQLNRNAMRRLDPVVFEKLPNLTYLDLRNTPLSCSCHNSELQNWTNTNQRVQIVYLYSMRCPDLSNSSFYKFDTKVCYLDIGVYLFVSTSNVVFLLTILPLLYVKLYWKLKYGYYVFRSWFGEQWRRLRDEEKECMYDAFISYNSADEEWVLKKLVPNLEGNGSSLRLCLHHRDFEPGRYIVDNIVSAVNKSRKTVCVVSQNFLRSEWCSLEIQLASYLFFHELRDVLVLVFLEHIPERQISAYHRMRKVMLKKTYLQWPGSDCTDPDQAQELFWVKLRRALGSSGSRGLADVEERAGEEDTFIGEECRVNPPQANNGRNLILL
ncbi:toll-like receptor 21 [Sardina pilchardus]|uniref:toll-like receptor 21 n=1 Tax=Sardina pilchardus TaxID=27697 RepID=UPI002E143648